MTEPRLECLNCGRENPPWAQTCRYCGVSLRDATLYQDGPPPRVPTDRSSLASMASAVGTIVVAVVIGLFLSNLDPRDATAGDGQAATPRPTPSIAPPPTTSIPPLTDTPAPTPTPLPGTLAFGTALDANTGEITEPTTTFGPGQAFAYSITMPEPLGVDRVFVEVVRVEADGTETLIQERSGGQPVDASSAVAWFSVDADSLISGFGVGNFIMRVYAPQDQLIAEGPFELVGS